VPWYFFLELGERASDVKACEIGSGSIRANGCVKRPVFGVADRRLNDNNVLIIIGV